MFLHKGMLAGARSPVHRIPCFITASHYHQIKIKYHLICKQAPPLEESQTSPEKGKNI